MFEGVMPLYGQAVRSNPRIVLGREEVGHGRVSRQSLKVDDTLGS
jgi:hypothetical protein